MDYQRTNYTVCILSNRESNNSGALQASVPNVRFSCGTASLLKFKDQKATAGGLWCPHFAPTMLQEIKRRGSAAFNEAL